MEELIEQEKRKFGRRLKFLRKERKLTQVDLEVLTGINHGDISRVESGKRNIELISIIKFATALNVETKMLFDYD